MNVGNVLKGSYISSYTMKDGGKKLSTKRILKGQMNMIRTRPTFPSDKITFSLERMTEDKEIRYIGVFFSKSRNFDLELFLEDSERYIIRSFSFQQDIQLL